MDLLKEKNNLNLYDEEWKIYSNNLSRPTQYVGKKTRVKNSLVADGCIIHGNIENSILFEGVYIGENTIIKDSVIMPNGIINDNVTINKAIIGNDAIIGSNCKIGNGDKIAIIAANEHLESEITLEPAEAL